jgi:hypothetical protein
LFDTVPQDAPVIDTGNVFELLYQALYPTLSGSVEESAILGRPRLANARPYFAIYAGRDHQIGEKRVYHPGAPKLPMRLEGKRTMQDGQGFALWTQLIMARNENAHPNCSRIFVNRFSFGGAGLYYGCQRHES